MTLPNELLGLADVGLEFAFSTASSGFLGGVTDPSIGTGGGAGSIPGAVNRTQSVITDILKAAMQQSTGWNAAHDAGYAGLTSGVPLVPNIMLQMADMLWDLTGLGTIFQPSDLLGFISGLPLLGGVIPGIDASKITSGQFGVAVLQQLIDAVSAGFGGGSGLGFSGLTSFLGGLSFGGVSFDDIIALIPGLTGGLSGSTGLGSIFTDLFGFLGSPTGVGSGSPVLPGISSIPLLGGLLSGGNILSSIIPGLDTSKITSGLFSISQIANLATLLGGFGTSTSILTQLLGVIPGLTGGLSGLTGLGSVFTDLFGLLGSPTALGSGTPTIPGLSSIPILGGLFSGGTFLTSLIPALNANILYGLLPFDVLGGVLPVSHIIDGSKNLITDPDFLLSGSVVGEGVWFWDNTVTTAGGNSVRVVANGTLKEFSSNLIRVEPGQKIHGSAAVKWISLTGSGSPIKVEITKFLDDTLIGSDTLGSVAYSANGGFTTVGADYVVPSGVNRIALTFKVISAATGGTVHFAKPSVSMVLDSNKWSDIIGLSGIWDTFSSIFGGTGTGNSMSDVLSFGTTFAQIPQDIIDTIFQELSGSSETGLLISDLANILNFIPFSSIVGVGGPADIGGTVQTTWDKWIGGLVGTSGSGSSLSDLFNISQIISSKASLGAMGWDILGIRNNKSLNSGFLPTTESNFGLDKVALQSTAPTFALTQSTAITGYHRISEAGTKGVVSWHGSGVASITDAYVNIFKMNTTTGDNTLVHQSANIIGSLSGSMQQNVYTLPTPLNVQAGEVYGVEIAIRGAGTHSIVGQPTWLPNQTVYPRRYSSVRNSGTSAPPSSFTPTYGTNVPFIEFGVSAGDVVLPHSPELVQLNASDTYPIPDWANFVDRIAVGGGGAGHVGGTWGISGQGGLAGTWTADTRSKASGHFTTGQSVTVTVPAAAAGGSGNGANGGNVTAALNGNTLTATGGAGSTSYSAGGAGMQGVSPGNYTYDGITYAGGVTQSTFGANGSPPGGGGAGGNYISFQHGGDGAKGAVWLRFRQT